MVLSQEIEYLLRFGRLGEGGVTAQIAEYDDDFAAMAFEDLLVTLRDDELGQLRREEPLQPPDPAQFANLLGDPRFQAAIKFGHLLGALAQFAKEPRILHGDDCLRSEIFQERDLLVGKWADFAARDRKGADRFVVLDKGDPNKCASTTGFDRRLHNRVASPIRL